MKIAFNRTAVTEGASIEDPSQDLIEGTPNLRQVSLEDAVRYGGSITRAALGAMKFKGDRNNIVVDTKVHFLMPGFIPAVPGWHTDGVPRGDSLNPGGSGAPRIDAQIENVMCDITPPRYHLLVTGTHCPTRFLNMPMMLDVTQGRGLYEDMSKEVNRRIAEYKEARPANVADNWLFLDTKPSTVYEWDWWNIHTAQQATARGWRYLIRVTETDHITTRTNPADFIRTQNQVYVPTEFGW